MFEADAHGHLHPRPPDCEPQVVQWSQNIALTALKDVMGAYGLDWRHHGAYDFYLTCNATEGPTMLQRLRSKGEDGGDPQ